MAKAAVKTTKEKAPAKKPAAKATSKTKPAIDKVAQDALNKLKALNLDAQVQADLDWCIGSYKYDRNPVGLIENIEKALGIFKTELARKTKGITAKFVSDLEKALAAK
jgi:hypothetical protein